MQLIEHESLFGAMEYGFEQLGPMLARLWWLGFAFVVVEPTLHFLGPLILAIGDVVLWLVVAIATCMAACSLVTRESIKWTRESSLYVASALALMLWWAPVFLPEGQNAFAALAVTAWLFVGEWIVIKLSASLAFFFLYDPAFEACGLHTRIRGHSHPAARGGNLLASPLPPRCPP